MSQSSRMKSPYARALRGDLEPDVLRPLREQSPQNSLCAQREQSPQSFLRAQREQSPQSFFRAQRENGQFSNPKSPHALFGTKKTLNLERQVDLEPTPSAKNLTQ